ncbi:MAG: hypothetical protein ABIL22_02015 [candidate division WOR-3 bacterium]
MLVIIPFVFCQKKPTIDFYAENITIEIDKSRARVSGTYFFENLTPYPKRIKFYYPFPVDSLHSYPDTILLAHPYEKDSTGIHFAMSIGPKNIDSFKIVYEQKLKRNQFRYITTTTKKWQRPIKEARFTIVSPQDLSPQINYHIAKEETIANKCYYFIIQKEFYPGEDLIIKW